MSKQNIMARDILQCKECREDTQILMDYSQGIILCRNCGLVLETGCIDDSQEWRNFSDSMGDTKSDRNRVGGISNDLLTDQGVGTSIAPGSSRLSRTQFLAMASESLDRTLNKAHAVLKDAMKALGLSDSVYGRCCEIIKHLDSMEQLRNRTNYSWILAVVYMACRQERAGRTITELVRAQPSVKEAEVARNYWKLDKLLAGTTVRDGPSISASMASDNYVVRYCSKLGITPAERIAEHVSVQANRFGLSSGRSPNLIAAASIFLVAHLINLPNKPTLEAVAEVAQVKPSGLKSAYAAIRQPIERILPSELPFDIKEALQRLP